MEKKQTALQWFLDKLPHSIETQFSEQIQQALQMEMEQIIKSNRAGVDMVIDKVFYVTGEQYYNETYGGHNDN